MLEQIKTAIESLEELSKTKPIKVVSHFDTDGITSAAVFSTALRRWGKSFSLQIVKSLTQEFIKDLPEDHILIFLDLASGSLDYLKEKKTEVFILDHHEITQEIPDNVTMISPILQKEEMISGAGICYLFAKSLSEKNKDLANLALIGMVGDLMERDLSIKYNYLIEDSETVVKKGLLLYPSTRPLDRALEWSSNPLIPGVTGSREGSLELLRDSGIERTNGKFKSLSELTEKEMASLITATMLRFIGKKQANDLIGNIYLVKFFNKLEDARELSALINACSRMGNHDQALAMCLGNKKAKEESAKIYIKYKQLLVSALKHAEGIEKISGKDYTILNAKDKIKDTIIGTVASIMSFSPTYEKGTIIVALAYSEENIKVSARLAGREGKNVREVLAKAIVPIGGEVGGHPAAAGCLVSKDQEEEFLSELQKTLEIETPEKTNI